MSQTLHIFYTYEISSHSLTQKFFTLAFLSHAKLQGYQPINFAGNDIEIHAIKNPQGKFFSLAGLGLSYVLERLPLDTVAFDVQTKCAVLYHPSD